MPDPKRDRPGEYIGFRAPPALKKKLQRAATAAGRSLSSEVQLRLEQSFRDDLVIACIASATDHLKDGIKMALDQNHALLEHFGLAAELP